MKRLLDMGVTALSLNINLNIFSIHKELKMMLMNLKLSLAACMAAMFFSATAVDVSAQTVERISVASDGAQANGPSLNSDMSSNGRYTVFESRSTNLVPGITVPQQIYLHDRSLATTELISVSESGAQSSLGAADAKVSDNGRYVVFSSWSDNLVPGFLGLPMPNQIYFRDRLENKTVLISKTASGGPAATSCYYPDISADGRYIVYICAANNLVADDTNNLYDVFVYDRMTSQTQRVSVSSTGVPGNHDSFSHPEISADGRYVAFSSSANNLVDSDTNNVEDVFVHDRIAGTTKRISVSSGGVQGNGASRLQFDDISQDGRFIAFVSSATNLVDGDTNGLQDLFVHDQSTGTTERVSIAPNGGQFVGTYGFVWSAKISEDGRYVAFSWTDTNQYFGYVRDRQNGATTMLTFNGGANYYPTRVYIYGISSTGRSVLFYSNRPDIVPGDTNNTYDVFMVDQGNTCQY